MRKTGAERVITEIKEYAKERAVKELETTIEFVIDNDIPKSSQVRARFDFEGKIRGELFRRFNRFFAETNRQWPFAERVYEALERSKADEISYMSDNLKIIITNVRKMLRSKADARQEDLSKHEERQDKVLNFAPIPQTENPVID